MNRWFFSKSFGGLLWHCVYAGLFIGLSLLIFKYLEGVPVYLASTVLRLLFGTGILMTSTRLFGKSYKSILSFSNTKGALLAASGFLLFFVYYCVTVASGFGGFTELTVGIFLSKVLLLQIATGFYEELNYRYLLLEGLNYVKNGLGLKIIFAFGNAVIFGLLHYTEDWNTSTFLHTGAFGFAFAVIFICSGNIVIPMLLHFLYDVIANLTPHVIWKYTQLFSSLNDAYEIMLAVMVIVSLIILIINSRESVQTERNI